METSRASPASSASAAQTPTRTPGGAFTFVESLRSAWESLRGRALRSFLSTLGIAIGIVAVTMVVALMQGVQDSTFAEFEGIGGTGLTVTSYTSYEVALANTASRLTPQDYDLVTNHVDGIASMTPVLTAPGQWAEVRNGPQVAPVTLFGTTHTYQEANSAYVGEGRFISFSDDQRRRRVAVLGHEAARLLGLSDGAIGQYIDAGGEWLQVIGVMEPRGIFGPSQDRYVLLPYNTLYAMHGAEADLDIAIRLTIVEGEELDTVRGRIERLLRRAHGIKPGEDDDFMVQSPEELGDVFETIGNVVTAGLVGIVSISLIVGGIGIMNIMLVSVTERTREIGILKAIGATRRQILLQFLTEAIALSLLGGVAGVATSYALCALISALMPNFSVAVPLWAVGLAVGFTTATGIGFGIMPASKAANLHPIEALRYE